MTFYSSRKLLTLDQTHLEKTLLSINEGKFGREFPLSTFTWPNFLRLTNFWSLRETSCCQLGFSPPFICISRVSSLNLTPEQGTHALPIFSLVGTSLAVENDEESDMCNSIDGSTGFVREADKCRNVDLKFRSIDGSCNNRQNAIWGQANVALQRLLHPKYEDGEFHLRSVFIFRSEK